MITLQNICEKYNVDYKAEYNNLCVVKCAKGALEIGRKDSEGGLFDTRASINSKEWWKKHDEFIWDQYVDEYGESEFMVCDTDETLPETFENIKQALECALKVVQREYWK